MLREIKSMGDYVNYGYEYRIQFKYDCPFHKIKKIIKTKYAEIENQLDYDDNRKMIIIVNYLQSQDRCENGVSFSPEEKPFSDHLLDHSFLKIFPIPQKMKDICIPMSNGETHYINLTHFEKYIIQQISLEPVIIDWIMHIQDTPINFNIVSKPLSGNKTKTSNKKTSNKASSGLCGSWYRYLRFKPDYPQVYVKQPDKFPYYLYQQPNPLGDTSSMFELFKGSSFPISSDDDSLWKNIHRFGFLLYKKYSKN